jgi:D-3-phosphoglycerate dehydrogenase / 2-oxoglutarate reductase
VARKILLTTPRFLTFEPFVRDFLNDRGCEIIEHGAHDMQMKEETLLRLVPEADGLVTALEPVTARVLAAAPRLRVICATGVGYDHIDVEAATRHGVTVCISAGSNHQSVAELTLGLMIALARDITRGDRALREGGWARLGGPELRGKTLGVVGLGRVGKSVALLARAFGMQVLATDVVLDHTFATTHCVEYVPLQKLLRLSDVVSLHCPLLPATSRLMNDRTLALMKPTAYLINTARGPVVDEAALVRALRAGRIAGAALDVFEAEPTISLELRSLPNVILTPHVGGSADEALARMIELALLNVTLVLDGAEPVCRVN